MYWLNPRLSLDELTEDLRRVRENRLTIIRTFVHWEEVESAEGTFDFSAYDRLYEAAGRNGLKIAQTLGIYPPSWMTVRLKERKLFSSERYQCLDVPDFSEPCAAFVRAVVRRFANHPATAMWILWNEPVKAPCTCRFTEEKFQHWLTGKYGGAAAMRTRLARENHIFNSIHSPSDFQDIDLAELKTSFFSEKRNYALALDWLEFGQVNLAENLGWLAELVRSLDQEHPVHANPCTLLENGVASGADPWLLAGPLDSLGASIHPCHHFSRHLGTLDPVRFEADAAFSYIVDLTASAARDGEFWISELQAGANINSGQEVFAPSPEDIKAWILHAKARGARGLLFWLWQGWRSAWEAGEFSLVNAADGGETDRSRMVRSIGDLLEANQEILRDAVPEPARVAILYSPESLALAVRESTPHDWPVRALFGCYHALWKANIAVDFVTPSEIEDGRLEDQRYRVLFAPYVKVVRSETGDRLGDFVRNGGALWADGHFAQRGEHSHVHPENPGAGLAEIFGCRVSDLFACREAFDLTLEADGSVCPGFLFQQELTPLSPTAAVAGCFSNGKPAIVTNTPGSGRTMLVGTYLAIGHQRKPDPATESLMVNFALETPGVRRKAEIFLCDSPPSEAPPFLEVSALLNDCKKILVVTNRSSGSVEFRTESPILTDLATGKTSETVHLAPRDTALLHFSKPTNP